MNNRLEHDVYKPMNISHLYYFVLLASYICGSTAFRKFILIKMPDFHCYFTKLNRYPHGMLCISNLHYSLSRTILSTC